MLHELWVGIACDVAYHVGWVVGRHICAMLGLNVHLPACRVATALLVMVVAYIYAHVEAAIAAGLATSPGRVVHWFGKQAGGKVQ
eukprot:9091911-Karenia_brevis.AAC.1